MSGELDMLSPTKARAHTRATRGRNFALLSTTALALSGYLACESSGKDHRPPVDAAIRAANIRATITKLGRGSNFLIGHGNDLPGAEANYDFSKAGIYTLPTPLDVHYVYLTGLPGEGGWSDDNDGGFVSIIANNAGSRGITPMFTLYQMAARGDGNIKGLDDADFMTKYWMGARHLFEELGRFDKPSIAHIEPDFWGYAQRDAPEGDPRRVRVRVGSLVPECIDLPEDMTGFGRCMIRLSRSLAPKAAIGFHASGFGALGDPAAVGDYLVDVGASQTDMIMVETLDRDAGCYEAISDPECKRREPGAYWDETNKKSPHFHDHLGWARTIHEQVGMPLLWWQMPLGVPSDTPGGTARAYRDNRARYVFGHIREFIDAGGIGAAFGPGGANQTNIATDGGQLAGFVTAYYANPVAL